MRCETCRGKGQIRTYRLLDDGRAIECRRCGLTSHNLNDVRELFCGNCRLFHTHTAPCPDCNGCGVASCCDGMIV